jgi:EF-P beta-lysylation protein EpmB
MQKVTKRQTWQTALTHAVTKPAELLQILELDTALLPHAKKAAENFKLRVPRGFIERMEKGNAQDPLLLQVLPLAAENLSSSGFVADPLNEKSVNPVVGLLHKYYGRVLVTLMGICGINCRFCFRREFPYQANNPGQQGWEKIFSYLHAHPEVNEIILSGGDPFIASDLQLQKFTEKLLAISHIKTLRIHTRMPIVLPERITTTLIQWLKKLPLRKIIALHCNHPNEINASVIKKLRKLTSANVTLLNQTVLLKNVNDNAASLCALSEKLFSAGVLPYYLHLLDKVRGAAHFEVKEAVAKKLVKQMQLTLPGYLVPRLVRENPGEKSKTIISL